MKNIEKKGKTVHLIGIGGISMSAIAKYLAADGYTVTGSDLHFSDCLTDLQSVGIRIFVGHNEKNVYGADCVICNSAVAKNNVELKAAEKLGLPIYSRGQALRMISDGFGVKVGVAGCHGKTTATAMLANIFAHKKLNFMSHIGGEDINLSNFYYTGREVFLSEICEFKRNIDLFSSDVACLLNIGLDHVDCYKDLNDIKDTYFNFLNRATYRIINADDQSLAQYKKTGVFSYGIKSKSADVLAENISDNDKGINFNVRGDINIKGITVCSIGEHNVYNALNAILTAHIMGFSNEEIKEGLKTYNGVKRRFERIGKINGADIICDYAHHPQEIRSSIQTTKKICRGKLFIIFQPHTYSRTEYFMNDFVNVLKNEKNVSIYQTYAAREAYSEKGSALTLYKNVGTADKLFYYEIELKEYLNERLREGDIALVLGAGDIYQTVKNITN